ncbi:methylaspartate mutase accessory protein GlmL [Peptoniphilus equinus]|uniref:Methylaspartate mutase accessory protein GlmL n=1 Tax=Peptoniphilus equinus TaxID=3016343 RepID=A0ABY7QVY0_9FIRM|nr:methylaspartate mutase accessory protein GlmL [Peptoniphilus equinus]WBW50200.1 methylaspartate mutase accessory protein GlmL [Peptoniphilus equinus]
MNVLLVDIGSTYTKMSLVDTEQQKVVGSSLAITTIDTSVMDGYHEALAALKAKVGGVKPDKVLTCSSAAGGLKMVAIGLGPNLTAEASKRAALGAGARVLKTFSMEFKDKHKAELDALNPDIILFSGGSNNGDKLNTLNNARMLSTCTAKAPVVIACNEAIAKDVDAILSPHFTTYVTENVMPAVNEINPDPVRRIIRKIFMEHITLAKGLETYVKDVGPVLMATPDAALQGARLLSEGYEGEDGLGDLLVVDIGGATTDVHSIGYGLPKWGVRFYGLKEPFDKRTVEGDLGMRYSARSLYETVGDAELNSYYVANFDRATLDRTHNIRFVPHNDDELNVDVAMAKAAVRHSMARHVGAIKIEHDGSQNIKYQRGKDLSSFKAVIGTGGVLVHAKDPKFILALPEGELLPDAAAYYIDGDYLLSQMGLLATEVPDVALNLLKTHIRLLK